MARVRRTKAEIEAGFPQELKAKGIKFEDWQAEKAAEKSKLEEKIKQEEATPSHLGVRRTQEEIDAGFPIEEKRNGVTFEEWKAKASDDVAIARKLVKIDPPPEPKQPATPKPKIEYVKHTERVIMVCEGHEEEVRDLIAEAYDDCIWEWKEVPIDAKFKVAKMTSLGKQGWRFAYIFDPKMVDEKSKKPQVMMFQRPWRKKK